MPIQVTCPSCQTTLKTADSSAGKRAKCPKCGGIIEIPPPVVAESESDEYELEPVAAPMRQTFTDDELSGGPTPDADRRPCPACGEMISRKAVKCRFCNEIFDKSLRGIASGPADVHDPGWLKVRGGLATLYYSITIIFATVVIMIVIGMIMGGMGAIGNGPGDGPPVVMAILFMICGLVMLGAAFGTIIGQVRCASVPAESGAKGFATGAAICIALYILTAAVGGAAQIPALSLLGSLASLVGSVLFILFIRKSANFLDDADLAASAGQYLIFCVVAILMGVGLGVAGAAADLGLLLGLVVLGAIIVGLVSIVWYLRLVKGLMTTIDQRMSAR